MAFRPLNYDEGQVLLVPGTASEAFTKGAALTYASGLLTAAASGTAVDVYFVAAETITLTSAGGPIKVWPTVNVLYEADVDSTWATADQGTLADLASASTINPDASDNDLFLILYGIGATGVGSVVVGRFMHANET